MNKKCINPHFWSIIAVALNGVPTIGPQETNDGNAVEPDGSVKDAQYWRDHPTGKNVTLDACNGSTVRSRGLVSTLC